MVVILLGVLILIALGLMASAYPEDDE
jgi:hypothetical protein